ncbi:hypothetical protein [Nonomuraea sp. NPDC049400]|uniref:hypothetical protein n=1 Tax=Nonomuraea sp. NPDC049400 TaxID=3364352 RepID=UPI0037AACF13
MTAILMIVAAVFLPPAVLVYAQRDDTLHHLTLQQRWQARRRWATRRTRTAAILNVPALIVKVGQWLLLLLVWIAIGLVLAAAELGGETLKALTFALAALFAGLFLAVDFLIRHGKHLLKPATPAWAPRYPTATSRPALPHPV